MIYIKFNGVLLLSSVTPQTLHVGVKRSYGDRQGSYISNWMIELAERH